MTDFHNREIKKHVAAIHISNSLTFTQQKASNILLLNAYDDLLTKEKHSIRVKDLANLIGFDSHNLDVLKDALRGLMSSVLEWNLLSDDGKDDGWEGCPMLSGVRIRKGWCTYTYSTMLREKLYNPEIYARINLAVQTKFSSGYALSLYENCVRFRKIGTTGWISLDLYRKLMGIPEGKYADFKRLSARVIRDPIRQINNSSDIYIEDPEYQREKRKVVAVRFTISDNPQLSLFKFGTQKEFQISELVQENKQEKSELLQRLLEYGIKEIQAIKIIQQYEEPYLQDNLDIVDRDYQAGKVKNLPAYTIAAIKADYRPTINVYETKQAEKKQAAKKQAERAQQAHERLEVLRNEFQSHRLQQALDHLSQEKEKNLRDRFMQKKKGDRFFARWVKEGFKHRVVQALYRSFAAEELLEKPTDEEFMDFVQDKGEDLKALQKTAGKMR